MSEFSKKLKALLSALPAQLAAVQSLLTAVAVIVVPVLPDNLALRVSAVVVVATGWVATAIRVVSSVTPVPNGAEGLLMPPNRELSVELRRPSGAVVSATTVTR